MADTAVIVSAVLCMAGENKLAANYLAFVQLASIRLWLRVNEFTP
jgi:hypothetical protein